MLDQWQPFTVDVIIYASAETHNVTNTQTTFAYFLHPEPPAPRLYAVRLAG